MCQEFKTLTSYKNFRDFFIFPLCGCILVKNNQFKTISVESDGSQFENYEKACRYSFEDGHTGRGGPGGAPAGMLLVVSQQEAPS